MIKTQSKIKMQVLTELNINFLKFQGQLTLHPIVINCDIYSKFKLIQDVAVALEENLIENEGARLLTTLNIIFSNCQGQITP